jgi:AcrR family transcriptional regulator
MGAAPTTPARGRPRDPKRDEAILGAALALLEEVGFERTSVDAIAERAGVGKATIYRRWPEGKSQLVIDALVRLRAPRATPDTGSLRGDLLALVHDGRAKMAGASKLAAGLTCRMQEDPDFAARVREHLVEHERAKWRTVAARAIERGELAAAPPQLFADLAPAVMHTRIALLGEPLDDGFADELVDRVLLPVLHHHPTNG